MLTEQIHHMGWGRNRFKHHVAYQEWVEKTVRNWNAFDHAEFVAFVEEKHGAASAETLAKLKAESEAARRREESEAAARAAELERIRAEREAEQFEEDMEELLYGDRKATW
jgi:hypothetical protein